MGGIGVGLSVKVPVKIGGMGKVPLVGLGGLSNQEIPAVGRVCVCRE